MMLLSLIAAVRAETPCAAFTTPTEVVEAALRVQGAKAAGLDERPERRALVQKLSCVSDPLTAGDAAAVHLALRGARPDPRPPPTPADAQDGPPHPDAGVALVDGVAFASLPAGRPTLVQAFDAQGRAVYTRFLDAEEVAAVQRRALDLPSEPSVPTLPPVPLNASEVGRLVVGGALVASSGVLFALAADARADWYAYDPSPVSTPDALERLRVRANLTQGAGIACAGLGAAGLLSVAVRVPF